MIYIPLQSPKKQCNCRTVHLSKVRQRFKEDSWTLYSDPGDTYEPFKARREHIGSLFILVMQMFADNFSFDFPVKVYHPLIIFTSIYELNPAPFGLFMQH